MIGGAVATVVKSLIDDILMPPIGMLLGGVDFSDLYFVIRDGSQQLADGATLAQARAAGAVTVNYGQFINQLLSFMVIAWVLYFIVRGIGRLRRVEEAAPAAPNTKECRYCATSIPLAALRCPHCTSELDAG
jgi:large conductance mechanosensitive channel